MSVVGFDLGNESCVIACIRRKQIEVLQNDSGNRKTATCVGFLDNQRLIADDGIAQLNSNYKNSILPLKRLIGRKANPRFFKEEGMFITTKITEEKEGMFVNVKYDSKNRLFPPESLVAMQLGKLKNIAQKKLGIPVKDCVIGVPAWWNDQQRRSMLDAAQITGLNVMRLMNETTAVALNYGILRTLTDNKVIFVDMGYSSLNVSLVAFGKGKLQVLGTATDPNLGGRNFDELLMNHFNEYIKKKYKMDVMSKPKPKLKLRKECTRVKKVLSANKKVRLAVEYIMNETDVKGEITRDEFEELAKPLLERLLAPLNQLLNEAKVDKSELHSVEHVGGAMRMPCVKNKLKEWFGSNLSATCDGDESVARGCALQCAMLAPFVKVRDFEVNDVTPYGIQLYWQPYSPDDKRTLAEIWSEDCTNNAVPPLNPIPSKKMITFKDKTEPFQFIAKYEDLSKLPADTEPFLGRWVITDIPKSTHPTNEGTPLKIKVKFQLDLNGIFSVSAAQSVETWEVEVEEEVKVKILDVEKENKENKENTEMDTESGVPKEKEVTANKHNETDDKPQETTTSTTTTTTDNPSDQTTDKLADSLADGPGDKLADSPADKPADQTTDSVADSLADKPADSLADKPTDQPDENDQKNDGKNSESKPKENKDNQDKPKSEKPSKPKYRIEKKKTMKSKKNRVDIFVNEEFVQQMDAVTLKKWQGEERNMLDKDREIQETNELRNSLEGYVLEMRGKIEGELSPYMKETAKETFLKELNDMEEWLQEDGYDAEKKAFEVKLKNLKLTGDPVDKRAEESKRRPECIKNINRALAESKALAASKDKKYDHILKADRDKVMEKCTESEKWLANELKKQDPLSLADDPVVLCKTLEDKKRDLSRFVSDVMNKPKPKPKKKKEDKKKEKSDKADKSESEKGKDVSDGGAKSNGVESQGGSTEPKNVQDAPEDPLGDPSMDLGCD